MESYSLVMGIAIALSVGLVVFLLRWIITRFLKGSNVTKPVQQQISSQRIGSTSSSRGTSDQRTDSVFLSYASEDLAVAKKLANALESNRWSVWWDRRIPPGKSFDEVIDAALSSANCVIVLWSKASVSSQWVKTEAAEGLKRRILVPALIEDVTIPLEFRRIQAANLIGWRESVPNDGFDSLVASATSLLGDTDSLPSS